MAAEGRFREGIGFLAVPFRPFSQITFERRRRVTNVTWRCRASGTHELHLVPEPARLKPMPLPKTAFFEAYSGR